MILILADGSDAWSTLVHRELSRRGEEVVWVQSGEVLDRILLNWSVMSDGSVRDGILVIDGRSIALDDFTGVLVRLPIPPPLSFDDLSPEDRSYVTKETTAAWLALLDALPCAVVNRPVPGGRPTVPSCSVEHSRLVQRHGFLLPPSHCTRSRSDAIAQSSAWHEKAYIKPLGSLEPGVFLDALSGETGEPLPEGRSVLMQAVPDGQRVTVYVAAGEAVGTVVHPDGHSDQNHILSPLPTEQCVHLTRDLGLAFAECELVVAADRAYCLDVSASPHYWRCPHDIQRRIVRSLSDYLSQQRSIPFHDSVARAHGRFGSC